MKKPPARCHPFSLRLSHAQRRDLERRAGQIGMAAYIRTQLFTANDNAPLPGKQAATNHRHAAAQILAKLSQGEVVANLRTLVEAARSGSLVLDDEAKAALLQAYEDIAEIKSLLMQTLDTKER